MAPSLTRTYAIPFAEGSGEGRNLRISHRVGDLGQRQLELRDIGGCKAPTRFFKQGGKRGSFLCQPTLEGPTMHAERFGEIFNANAVGRQRPSDFALDAVNKPWRTT